MPADWFLILSVAVVYAVAATWFGTKPARPSYYVVRDPNDKGLLVAANQGHTVWTYDLNKACHFATLEAAETIAAQAGGIAEPIYH